MKTVSLEFQIKRGIVLTEDIDDPEIKKLVNNAISLCKQNKNEEAIKLIYPKLEFEWDWSNGDGNPEDYFLDVQPINFKCNPSNSSLKLGVDDDNLIVTINIIFSVKGKSDINRDELSEWLDDNSMYACGYVSAGWPYAGSDGDNVWINNISVE